MVRRLAAPLALLVALAVAFIGLPAYATTPGSTPENPITVTDFSKVPADAVKTPDEGKCSTTYTWVVTTPGQAAVKAFRYKRVIPGQDGTSHKEWCLKERTREWVEGTDEESYLTWAKEKRTREYVEATEPETGERYEYKREVCETKTVFEWEKHVKGTKETRKNPNSPWKADGNFDWRDYPGAGPTWDDKSGDSGGHNSTWTEGNTRYHSTAYKYVKTGKTKTVDGPCKWEYSGWVTEKRDKPWILVETDTYVITPGKDGYWGDWSAWKTGEYSATKPNIPADTDDTQYRLSEPKKVVTKEATEGHWGEWSDWKSECHLLEKPVKPEDTNTAQYEVTGPETVEDTPAVPDRTEYYVLNGEPSSNEADASWIAESSLAGWVRFDYKVVTEAKPEVKTYYEYNDGKTCESPTPTPTPTTSTPSTPPPTTPPTTPPVSTPPPPTKTPTSAPPTKTVTTTPAKVSTPAPPKYENCTEVRNAGKAPIYPGQPGYRAVFDRDGDDIGCEETWANPGTLAQTGSSVSPWLLAGGLILLLAAGGLFVIRYYLGKGGKHSA